MTTSEAEQRRARLDAVGDVLAAVEHALGRLDAGTYERCERCDGVLDDTWRVAHPARATCPACTS